jgi:hypothetical protein
MIREGPFHYRPICASPGCSEPAAFKIAARWSDGTSQELKSYGLVCERHRRDGIDRARHRSASLRLAEGEVVGPVAVFRLESGRRDSDLTRVTENSG